MKILSLAVVGLAALSTCGAALAAPDTISFGDYFFPGDVLSNGFSSVTDGHVAFTVSGSGPGFTVETEGGLWSGEFVRNTTVIDDNGSAGPVTIAFGAPIKGIEDLAIQPKAIGAFYATLKAYDGSTLVRSQTVGGFNGPGPEGSINYFSITAPAITSIELSATNDADGVAVGGGLGIPEPASWTLMLIGSALAGGAIRFRRRRLI